MARGDIFRFHAAHGYRLEQTVNVSGTGWKLALLSVGIGTILVTESNPRFNQGTLTEVTPGGAYGAGGWPLVLANTNVNGLYTMRLNLTSHPNGELNWPENAGSPTNVKTALLYDSFAAGDQATHYWDLTQDGGTTPIDMTAADFLVDFSIGPGKICDWPV